MITIEETYNYPTPQQKMEIMRGLRKYVEVFQTKLKRFGWFLVQQDSPTIGVLNGEFEGYPQYLFLISYQVHSSQKKRLPVYVNFSREIKKGEVTPPDCHAFEVSPKFPSFKTGWHTDMNFVIKEVRKKIDSLSSWKRSNRP